MLIRRFVHKTIKLQRKRHFNFSLTTVNVKPETKLYSERNSLPQSSALFNLQSLKPGAFNLDCCLTHTNMDDFHGYSDIRVRNHRNRWLQDIKLCDIRNHWKYIFNLPCSRSYQIEEHFLRSTKQCSRRRVCRHRSRSRRLLISATV